MNKLRALEAFEDQDGKFAKGDEFWVNDERAFALSRTQPVERCADQSIDAPKPDASEDVVDETSPAFKVPRPPVTE